MFWSVMSWHPVRHLALVSEFQSLNIQEEVNKQFDAGFFAVAWYPKWVANIVPAPIKDGKVRMCVDYRDLNRANPKDNFPLPHINVLVDNVSRWIRLTIVYKTCCHTLISPGDLCLMTCNLSLVLVRFLAPIIRQFVKFRDMPEIKRKYWCTIRKVLWHTGNQMDS